MTHLPTDSAARKDVPLAGGCLDYFPDALAEVARLSKIGNDKHNPGQPLHWSRHKSNDHADCIMRHLIDRGTVDTDGLLHDVKVAWRALAMLQLALEKQRDERVMDGCLTDHDMVRASIGAPAASSDDDYFPGDPWPRDLHREPPGAFYQAMHTYDPDTNWR